MEARTFLRYFILGILATLIDIAVTLWLAQRWHYLLANSVGFLVANAVQFVLVHTWVFERALADPALGRAYVLTLSISAFGLALSNGVVWIGVALLGAALLWAKVAASAVGLALNYGLRRALVYR